MRIQARYYANLKGGRSIYLCGRHIGKVARKTDGEGRLSLKRGVRSIGSLHPYTTKQCEECLHDHPAKPVEETIQNHL